MGRRYGISAGMIFLGLVIGCQRSGEEGRSGTAAAKPATSAPAEGQSSAPGTIQVAGDGTNLYYVFDEVGERKVGFTKTGAPLTVPAGTYTVSLNNIRQKVKVEANGKAVLACGTLVVNGVGTSLYEVYDEAGNTKLGFTATGKVTELFPGTYRVVYKQKMFPAVVKPNQQTTIKPE